jgi:radical SAM protein with 4Fe4S-binding SPASM domain
MRADAPELRLTAFVRLFQDDGRRFAESLLTERALVLDEGTEAILRAAAQSPVSPASLARRFPDMPAGHIHGHLAALRDCGLLVEGDDDDRARFRESLSSPAPFPAIDQIELTNVCPMQCIMCPRGDGRDRRPTGFMDVALFEKIISEVAPAQRTVKPLGMHNLGESLLHPELEHLLRVVHEAGLRSELSVNPGLLPLERYQSLARAGLTRLVLSLDGLDAATLEKVRGPAARGEAAQKNVRSILDWRRRNGPDGQPEILVQMLRLKANAHQFDQFAREFGKLGLDNVSGFLKALDANTDAALFPEGESARPSFCRVPWRTVVVLFDGRVVPCCYDCRSEWILGDLKHQRLEEIWRGEPMERLRTRLRDGWPSPDGPCGSCAHRPDLWRRPSLDEVFDEPLHW